MDTIKLKLQFFEWFASIATLVILFRSKPPTFINHLFNRKNSVPLIILSFFILSSICKYLQFFTLGMNAQDFWLFVDMLENSKKGLFTLTNYAPQAWGPMQQGAIHPFFPWIALTPLTYIFDSASIGILFNPVCFAMSAFYLDRIAKHLKLDQSTRILIILAFLFSKQTSLTMMYEVHPEALYPFFSFGLVYSVLSKRWLQSILFGSLIGILKEDSFMVLWGCGFTILFLDQDSFKQKSKLFLVFAISTLAYVIQVKSIHYFLNHPNGGVIPESGVLVGNHKWDSLSSILEAVNSLLSKNGGILGSLKTFFSFLISDSWRGIILQSPWLVLSPGFWMAELPLAFSFSLRGEMAVFWNYYSVPFIAFIWIFNAKFLQNKNQKWGYALLFLTLINGSESMIVNIPQQKLLSMRDEAKSYQEVIATTEGRGVVLARLIPFVSLNRVISDRFPSSTLDAEKVGFYFLEKNKGSYNVSVDTIRQKISQLNGKSSGFIIKKETENLIFFGRLGKI